MRSGCRIQFLVLFVSWWLLDLQERAEVLFTSFTRELSLCVRICVDRQKSDLPTCLCYLDIVLQSPRRWLLFDGLSPSNDG